MKKIYLKAAILFSSIIYMVSLSIVPVAMGPISAQFADAGTAALGMVITISALFMIPTTLISGWLCRWVSKKTLLIIGIGIYTLSGILLAFADSITVLLLLRAVMGIGIGLSAQIPSILISMHFSDNERVNMMGMTSAVPGFFAIIIAVLAGILCNINWHYTFLLFGIGILIILTDIVFLPKDEPESKMFKEEISKGKLPPFGIRYFFIIAVLFFIMLFNGVFSIKIGNLIMSENLGDPTQVGLVTSMLTIGTLVGGLIFMTAFKILKRFTILISLIIYGVGFYLLATAHTIVFAFAGGLLIGFGLGIAVPFVATRISLVVPKVRITFAMAIMGIVACLGQFVAAFWAQLTELITGNNSPRTAPAATAVAFGVMIVITFIYIIATPEKNDASGIATDSTI